MKRPLNMEPLITQNYSDVKLKPNYFDYSIMFDLNFIFHFIFRSVFYIHTNTINPLQQVVDDIRTWEDI